MSSTATTALFIFLVLVAIGAAAFAVAWSAGRIARGRMERNPTRTGSRSWGGRDHDRVRTKYFDKERRARTVRDRTRSWAPPPSPVGDLPDLSSGESDRELAYRETLGLVGTELTEFALREAYRHRVREYHPDRVSGLGPKLQVLADEETKRINEAYKYLKQRLGE